VRGARARLGYPAHTTQRLGDKVLDLELALEACLRGEPADVSGSLERVSLATRRALPGSIGEVADLVLRRVGALPVRGERRESASFRPVAKKEAPLPAWIPPSRVI